MRRKKKTKGDVFEIVKGERREEKGREKIDKSWI